MTNYHCSCKIISRGKGQSAIASAAYRSGEKLHDNRLERTFDYTRKEHVDYSHIYAPEGTPEQLLERNNLWNEVEKKETRKDSQLAREIEVSLPNEFTFEQQRSLIDDYVQQQFVDKGMIADVNIHNSNSHNPHAHIMLTTRSVSNEGFGKKERDWNNKQQLERWRENWAKTQNRHLEQNRINERVDHRSYQRQNIDRTPQHHLGAHIAQIEREHERECAERGIAHEPLTELAQENQQIRENNNLLERLKEQLRQAQQQLQQRLQLIQEQAQQWQQMTNQERINALFKQRGLQPKTTYELKQQLEHRIENKRLEHDYKQEHDYDYEQNYNRDDDYEMER